jgi:two-component system, sensor histidine kinase and response regulator
MDDLKSKYTILIVDDVPTNVILVQAILKKEGYNLLTTDSGPKALRIADEKVPNLILLDIMMPGMDGYEVLQRLKNNPRTNEIPVIIMSALSDMQSIVKGYQLGAVEYVTKPFQREELLKRVGHRYELYSITHIKKELEETIVSRDTLYSVIAHDLRSPLGSLKMMNNAVLMMVDKTKVSTEVFEMLQMMNKTSEELFQLLDNLLKWVRNRLNKQKIFKQEGDINAIIRSTVDLFVPVAAQKHITIKTEGIDHSLTALFDVDMIQTIVRNIMSNAVKFSFENGTISVSTKTEGDNVIVSIKDAGKGIKQEDQDKILNSKVQFTTYGTNNEKGSGLGLMLCQDFVEMHNGKLWFESEEGKGTTFYFSLNVLNQTAPQQPKQA